MPRFPFSWGARVPPLVAPVPSLPRWTSVTAGLLAWQRQRVGLMPRLEHVFPQESGSAQQFVKVPPPD